MHPDIVKLIFTQPPRRVRVATGGGLFRRWLASTTRNWQRRRMIRALEAMDDRLLRDIGIHRGCIESVVDGFDDQELRMTPVAPTRPAPTLAGDFYTRPA